tara:strand:- start:1217 stop:1864 length:648 start_codon:yes stop_codon:yes gene_type:complete
MSTIIPIIHEDPKPEEVEEEKSIKEEDYFDNNNTDDIKQKLENIKNNDDHNENIIPETKPKRKYTMSKKKLESLEKARKVSAEKRRQRKEEKETLDTIKNDNRESQLLTELSDYKKTLMEVHNKNKELEDQIKELKNSRNKQSIPNHVPKYNDNNNTYNNYESNNPYNQRYTFEEMEYYSQERYKQLKEHDETTKKQNNQDQLQKLRDRYILGIR